MWGNRYVSNEMWKQEHQREQSQRFVEEIQGEDGGLLPEAVFTAPPHSAPQACGFLITEVRSHIFIKDGSEMCFLNAFISWRQNPEMNRWTVESHFTSGRMQNVFFPF